MQYRKEIDGLRAVAVVSVILFHANFSLVPGGFLGVDIFFVISGYLITHIILSEKSAGTFSLANFYERRARRILPALLVVLLCCLPAAWLWLIPMDMKSFAQSLVAVTVFSSNVFFYSTTGYFDSAAEWKPLLHTWSLALEEQYYVFFPLFVLLTWKLRKRINFLLLVLAALISLAIAQWGAHYQPSATFYLLHSRSWELLIGALAAYYTTSYSLPRINKNLQQLLSSVGLLLIVVALFAGNTQLPHPSLYTLAPTLGAVLIILFANDQTLAGRILGNRLFVGIGLISYSAYLWHWPLFVFARHRAMPEVPDHLFLGGLALAALVLGFLSWKFIEQPFRNKKFIKLRYFTASCILCCGLILGFGVMGNNTKGFPARINTSIAQAQPEIDFPWLLNGWCFYQPDLSLELPVGYKGIACWLGRDTSTKKAILLGDSYAGNYEPFWDLVGKQAGLRINPVTTNFCVPTLNEEWTGPYDFKAREQCLFNRRYFQENIGRYNLVILSANWMDYSAKGKLDSVVAAVDFAAQHAKLVVIMAAPKAFDINPVDVYNKSLMDKSQFDISEISTAADIEEAKANKILESLAKQYTNVMFLDRASLFHIDGQESDVTQEGIPYSFDGMHISTYGSLAAARAFVKTQKYKDFISQLPQL